MTSVFDVAVELLDRQEGESMDALKLQKLCFYAFGWYAHLTGEALFGETFYAMQYGPVVGELLSAHAGKQTVDLAMMSAQLIARDADDAASELDPYKTAVVDAVWAVYGHKSSGLLIDMTHAEAVWAEAWTARRPGSKRGDLSRDELLGYFLERTPGPQEKLELPPAMISRASASELEEIEAQSQTHQPFVDAVRSLRLVS